MVPSVSSWCSELSKQRLVFYWVAGHSILNDFYVFLVLALVSAKYVSTSLNMFYIFGLCSLKGQISEEDLNKNIKEIRKEVRKYVAEDN